MINYFIFIKVYLFLLSFDIFFLWPKKDICLICLNGVCPNMNLIRSLWSRILITYVLIIFKFRRSYELHIKFTSTSERTVDAVLESTERSELGLKLEYLSQNLPALFVVTVSIISCIKSNQQI